MCCPFHYLSTSPRSTGFEANPARHIAEHEVRKDPAAGGQSHGFCAFYVASTSPCRSFSSPNLLCYHSEGPCLKIAIADVLPAHSFPHPIRQFMKGFGTQTIMISLSICSSSLKPDPRVIIYSVYLFLTFFFFFLAVPVLVVACGIFRCLMWDLVP